MKKISKKEMLQDFKTVQEGMMHLQKVALDAIDEKDYQLLCNPRQLANTIIGLTGSINKLTSVLGSIINGIPEEQMSIFAVDQREEGKKDVPISKTKH
jgi:polyribonucleotide nucleotidyltransferase